MAIEFRKKVAVFQDVVSGDEAEGLLEWLQKKTAARIDLAGCTHLHPASLQVLMASKPAIVAWPEAEALRVWLEPLFKP
jgi:hypothetical protein